MGTQTGQIARTSGVSWYIWMYLDVSGRMSATSAVLKSHQAGKITSSPWHSGDFEKSHQVVESHIREEEPRSWHGLFHL